MSALEVENPPASSKLMASLQLLRLPNVFTAMADLLLGYLFTHRSLEPVSQFVLLLGSSSLLYLSGMVLNDVFDRHVDARERPGRPIPSGRISAKVAGILGTALLVTGIALGWLAGYFAGQMRPGLVASLLAVAILLYNGVLKKTPLGPLTMGSCRLLNVLLGMSVAGSPGASDPWETMHYLVAGGIGLYIVGVTWFARTEARQSSRVQLALSVLVMWAGIGLLAWFPEWRTGLEAQPIHPPDNWYLFWLMIGVLIGWRCLRAVIEPEPRLVQAAVKNCILSLIVLDAGVCMAVQPVFWAFVILLLLVPTILLGRWVYST